MYIAKGTTRVVVVFWGLAFKLPRTNPITALRHSIRLMKRGFHVLKKDLMEHDHEAWGSVRYLLMRGIISNRKERRFYKEHRLSICAPTIFSLLGLVNIQKAIDHKIEMSIYSWWPQIYDLTNGEASKISHTFTESDNFGFIDGGLVMLDYADDKTQGVLMKFGEKLQNEFDLFFVRKEN